MFSTIGCTMKDVQTGDNLLMDLHALTRSLCGTIPLDIGGACGLVTSCMDYTHGEFGWLHGRVTHLEEDHWEY